MTYVKRDTYTGQRRLKMILDFLRNLHDIVDITLRKYTFKRKESRLLVPVGGNILNLSGQEVQPEDREIALCDEYSLTYILGPQNLKSPEQKIGVRDCIYDNEGEFERLVDHQVGLSFEAIRNQYPRTTLRYHGQKVDDGLIARLKGACDDPIAFLSTQL
jgi:hypothetical protein